MRRLVARMRRDDAGYTLAELLVTMIILGIISIIVGGVFISGTRTTAASGVIVSDTESAQTVSDHLTRSLRASTNLPDVRTVSGTVTPGIDPGFVIASATEAKYYSYLKVANAPTTGPTLFDEKLQVSPQHPGDWQLVETTTPATTVLVNGNPTYTYTTGTTTRVVADGLANPASSPPLFTYYQPLYYSVPNLGSTCASPNANATPVASNTGGTTGYVGVQSPQFGGTVTPSVADSIGQVLVTVTASNTGVNDPNYTSSPKTVTVSSTVTIDAANSPASRPGTCL